MKCRVLNSNFNVEYPQRTGSWLLSVPKGKFRDNTSNYDTILKCFVDGIYSNLNYDTETYINSSQFIIQ
jgi:hypothetical protein